MKTDLIYGIEDRPPFKDALFAALQHLLAIFVAIITPPLIIAGALKLDVEKTGKHSTADFRMAVKIWLDRVEAHYGVKPILYTSYKFKTKYLDDPAFDSYPYWIAHYYVDSVAYVGQWRFWQHTDVGTVPGIKEEVDLNVFNGSLDELKALSLH